MSLVLLLNILDSTAAKREEALLGTWNVVHCISNVAALPPTLVQETRTEALSNGYTFHADGTFYKHSRVVADESGIWSFDPVAGTLAMYYTSGIYRTPECYYLDSLGKNEMTWVLDLGQSGNLTLRLEREKTPAAGKSR